MLFVSNCEREHPVELTDEIDSELFVRVGQHFGVAERCERVTTPRELLSQHFEVVDLTVLYGDYVSVLVCHRLAPTLNIDHG